LRRGADPRKDQSYFLSRLAQDQLAAAVLPLGGAAKPDVVRYVTDAGLPCRPQRESQDLCFVSEAGPGVWIDLRTLEPPRPGDFVDREGRRLGRHRGLHHYTVGQRKGLGLFGPAPLYVIRIEAATNRIVVGPHDAAMGRRLRATDLTWTRGAPPAREFQALTQIRHSHLAAPSTVTLGGDGTAEVVFEAPQFAIAPGQAAAFYEGDEVLGAGWIVDWEA
jgi:tRNA-specific 2-thiouridylase